MARTIAEIQQGIIDAKNADAVLSGLNSTSKSAIWLLWTWVVAHKMWITENLFDSHKAEVADLLTTKTPHTLRWYETKALAFQYGDSLPADSDVYAVIDASAQIVSYAAAAERSNGVRLKVAKDNGSDLAALSGGELTAFTAYVQRVKDAGVRVSCTSDVGDGFRLAVTVYYDPLILDSIGRRLDGTNDTPVQSAVETFISVKSQGFNGVFILNKLIAAIQDVEGVVIGEVNYCAAQYGLLPYSPIAAYYTPDAGYMVLDAAYFIANTTYTGYGVV